MSEKNAGRVCLKMDLDDPVQAFAYDLLQTRGRKKSILVAKALNYYAQNCKDAQLAENLNIYRTPLIRDAILNALNELGIGNTISDANSSGIPAANSFPPVQEPTRKSEPEPKIKEAKVEEEEEDEEMLGNLFDQLKSFG